MVFADDYEELYAEYKKEKDKIRGLYSSLSIMDMMLYKYTCDPPQGVTPFKTTQEMAEYFRLMLHTVLPEEYRY